MISFDCPHCGNDVIVTDDHAGRHAWCRKCQRIVLVPVPTTMARERGGRSRSGSEGPARVAGREPTRRRERVALLREDLALEREAREAAEEEIARLRKRAQIDADELRKVRDRLRQLEEAGAGAEFEARAEAFADDVARLEAALAGKDGQIEELEEAAARAESEAAELRQAQEQAEGVADEVARLEAALAEKDARLEELEQAAARAESETAELRQAREQAEGVADDVARLEAALAKKDGRIEELEEAVTRAEREAAGPTRYLRTNSRNRRRP